MMLAIALSGSPGEGLAGSQMYEPLARDVQTALHRAISDSAVTGTSFESEQEARLWVGEMSNRLRQRISDPIERVDFLRTVHYEARRAGLDPQLVLSVIQVESNFRKYAVSTAGARGYMQVMPFWVGLIGVPDHNLFHMRLNLRYGCVILRHYLDIEKGNLFRALGRYNGSLGQAWYPDLVQRAWQTSWHYSPPAAVPGVQASAR